jgi:hypothetical protein
MSSWWPLALIWKKSYHFPKPFIGQHRIMWYCRKWSYNHWSGPYPEPDESSPHPPTQFLRCFLVLTSYVWLGLSIVILHYSSMTRIFQFISLSCILCALSVFLILCAVITDRNVVLQSGCSVATMTVHTGAVHPHSLLHPNMFQIMRSTSFFIIITHSTQCTACFGLLWPSSGL